MLCISDSSVFTLLKHFFPYDMYFIFIDFIQIYIDNSIMENLFYSEPLEINILINPIKII